jgi:hypothetical protein
VNIVKLKGGLGNQMFQYAFGMILQKMKGKDTYFDLSGFKLKANDASHTLRNYELSVFNKNLKIASSGYIEKKLRPGRLCGLFQKIYQLELKQYYSHSIGYDPHALDVKTEAYYIGYFQSYKYYIGYESYVRNLFKFDDNSFDKINTKLIQNICDCNSVSVHIRRGDYITNPAIQAVHETCGKNYYSACIEYMKQYIENPVFYFFSDDQEWVKHTFNNLEIQSVFVQNNIGKNNWKDMYLMSKCKHNIIANSSFSWWGAWLNSSPHKHVIAPTKWFKDEESNYIIADLIPAEWTLMPIS